MMGRLLGRFRIFGFALLLVGCTTAETRSVVSKEDIPDTKYNKVVVFIENLEDNERLPAENIVVSTLQAAGLNAISSTNFFNDAGKLSEQQKARLVQKEFDAVLYLKVLEKGVFEELVPELRNSDGALVYSVPGFTFATDIGTGLYDLKPDGSVYKQLYGLKTQVDLQDTKSAKQVWTSETVATGEAHTSNMSMLFTQASNQIVAKLREDHAI
jgi:hypothetical protein